MCMMGLASRSVPLTVSAVVPTYHGCSHLMGSCHTRAQPWLGHDGAVNEAIAEYRKASCMAVPNDRVIRPRLKQTIMALETRLS
jgi:hypothetical protein